MEVQKSQTTANRIEFSIFEDGRDIARAYLCILPPDSPFHYHSKPFGFMTGVFVEGYYRSQGYGTAIIKELLDVAQQKCYKLIATSRDSNQEIHKLYEKLGFRRHGIEFRMDFETEPYF